MKIEFLDDISQGGKYTQIVSDHLIRFYDFDFTQAIKFKELIEENIIGQHKSLDIFLQPFIKNVNCNLIFRLSEKDYGAKTTDKENFVCDLTLDSYKHMVYLLEPFCQSEDAGGYQWLYDPYTDDQIDLLFSSGGTW